NWTVRLPVGPGTTGFDLVGKDPHGKPILGATNHVTVNYAGPVPDAAGAVVINEIMYNPVVPGAEYVELFNTSSNFTFDLSGWEFHGLSYTFHPGSYLAPRSLLVLVRDRTAAAIAYGTNLVAFDVFDGNLQANGETLTLLQPSPGGGAAYV